MKQNFYFYASVLVVAMIVIVGAFVYLNLDFGGYKYSLEKEGVLFYSNEMPVADSFSALRENKVFVIAPEFVEQGNENTYMVSAVTLFSTVLTAKGKDVILVARVLDEQGNLVSCQSNLGDFKTNAELSIEECNNLLNDSTNARIFISFPKALSKPEVVFSNNSASITPVSFQTINGISFAFLENLYPDSKQIIDTINGVVASAGA